MSLSNTQKLLTIMAQLRHPEEGCAWDLQQDSVSLIPYLIEEAYEVIDAIERDNPDELCAELGDLLLQVVFHARIAEEQGLFNFEQVSASIAEKLIRRHPHVFAGVSYANDEERQRAWDEAKALERKEKNTRGENESVLEGVAGSLPALLYCEKIQDRAALHSFDWPQTRPVFAKVVEELGEVEDAWQSGDQAHIQEEVGDLLLVVVNLARHLKVNPEIALKEATSKFIRRFHYIERRVADSDRELRDCQLAELDLLWDEAKRHLGGNSPLSERNTT